MSGPADPGRDLRPYKYSTTARMPCPCGSGRRRQDCPCWEPCDPDRPYTVRNRQSPRYSDGRKRILACEG